MFWKIFEWVVRIIYFKRFATAKRIGQAGELLVTGQPAESLSALDRINLTELHDTLHPLYHYTRGRILDGNSRFEEAIEEYECVLTLKPDHHRARLELAVLKGRLFDFPASRTLLNQLLDQAELANDVKGMLELLDQTEDGTREQEFQARAQAFARTHLLSEIATTPLAELNTKLDDWIATHPKEAQQAFDEIALLLGQAQVEHTEGAKWKVSLAIDGSTVSLPDEAEFKPFDEDRLRLSKQTQ